MCPGGQSSTKVSAKVSAKAAVVKVKKTARASPKMKATAETLRQDFTSKAELLVAVTPQEIQKEATTVCGRGPFALPHDALHGSQHCCTPPVLLPPEH